MSAVNTTVANKGSLEEVLNQSQTIPFAISVSHWLSGGPTRFQYKFICPASDRSLGQGEVKPGDVERYHPSQRCTIQIKQAGRKKVVCHDFIIFYTSEKTAVIVCEKLHGGKVLADPAICIPIKYSHVNKCWTAESSYRNISNLFTFGSVTSGFGLLTEIGCTNMKIKFYAHKMKISCHGPGGMTLNESQFVDADDVSGSDSF